MRLPWWTVLWCTALRVIAQLTANDSSSWDTSSTLWGAYRSNLYFGLRPRIPNSLMTGLLWFGTRDYQSMQNVRHACHQGDELNTYGWTAYDPREGGAQVIQDGKNNVEITTQLLMIPGGRNGGSWAARIKGTAINPTIPVKTSIVFYAGLEGFGRLTLENERDKHGIEGPINLTGSSPELGEFAIRIVDDPSNEPVSRGPQADTFRHKFGKTQFLGRKVSSGNIWRAKDIIFDDIVRNANDVLRPYGQSSQPEPSFVLLFSNEVAADSNFYALQKVFEGDFQFDVFFESASAQHTLSSSFLDEKVPALLSAYDKHFESTFPIPPSYTPSTSNRQALERFSKAITANLLGGVGYFYGTSIVDKDFSYEWDIEDEGAAGDKKSGKGTLTEPRALLTGTPSRSFFPRGFYWDEGFHLLHIGKWDTDFSLEILKDWIDLIDEDGWVAREQILGEEARSVVPPEFHTQVPSYANPPTLTMAVTAFIARLKRVSDRLTDEDLGLVYGAGSQIPLGNSDRARKGSRHLESPQLALDYLNSIYPALKRHYDWFRRTQRGQIKQYARKARSRKEAYRWRGRSEKHVLTSGMDDYPRGPPHAGELHLDLICWMGFFTRTMRDIADFVGQGDDAASFREIEAAILGNIEDLHWNEQEQMYCDASVNDNDESYHVCHRGYLSLFPFLLGLLPSSSPHLGSILDLLYDPAHLWSPYGLRSLSASHELFGKDENYWRGPVWIQMNYLALKALFEKYAKEHGPYQAKARKIYEELRRNVVDNVFKEYERTGYVWEQYDAITGKGQRSHPFTGWTSLVTLILSETYE